MTQTQERTGTLVTRSGNNDEILHHYKVAILGECPGPDEQNPAYKVRVLERRAGEAGESRLIIGNTYEAPQALVFPD